ncbi:hypothetical protein TB2_035761 [Malus domestica]
MRLLLHWPLRKLSFLSSSTSGLRMASKQLLKSAPLPNPLTPSARRYPFHPAASSSPRLPRNPCQKFDRFA